MFYSRQFNCRENACLIRPPTIEIAGCDQHDARFFSGLKLFEAVLVL